MKFSDAYDVDVFSMILMTVGMVLLGVGVFGITIVAIVTAFTFHPFMGFLTVSAIGIVLLIIGSNLGSI